MSIWRSVKIVFCVSPKKAMAPRRIFLVVFVAAALLIACLLLTGVRVRPSTIVSFNQEDKMHSNTEVNNDKSSNGQSAGDPLVREDPAMAGKQTQINAESNFHLGRQQELEDKKLLREQLRRQQELFDKQHSLMQEFQEHHNQRERELQQEIQQLQRQIRQLEQQNGLKYRPLQANSDQSNNSPQTTNGDQEQPALRLHPDVNILPSYPPPGLVLPYKDCVPLPKFPLSWVQICIHPTSDDKYVSGSLKNNELWEEALILNMQKALEADTSLMLLDLGCNIGEYTLWAAGLGREVVAVEMLITNVELIQTSLQLSRVGSRVTIVNNAVYSDHRVLEVMFMSQNIGGSRLNTSKFHEVLDTNKVKVSVKTICLDDLLPLLAGKSVFIKMDIENSEHHALACAHKLFTEANVKIIQMEWMDKSQDEEDQIMQFMNSHGYVMSESPLEYRPMSALSKDLYFLKKSSFNVH